MDAITLKSELAYVLTELGINVGIESEVLNEILRITNGNVKFMLDESLEDLIHDHDLFENCVTSDILELITEFKNFVGFITELIAVIPHELLEENSDVTNMFSTIVLMDDVEDATEINTEVPILAMKGRKAIYISRNDIVSINLQDLKYIKALPNWIGLDGMLKHEYEFDKSRAIRVLSIIRNSENPSVELISRLMSQPRFVILMDVFVLECATGVFVRDKLVDVMNDADGVSVSIRESIPTEDLVAVLSEETTLSKENITDVISALKPGEFVPMKKLERKTSIAKEKFRKTLSALTRAKALSFQFDVNLPFFL